MELSFIERFILGVIRRLGRNINILSISILLLLWFARHLDWWLVPWIRSGFYSLLRIRISRFFKLFMKRELNFGIFLIRRCSHTFSSNLFLWSFSYRDRILLKNLFLHKKNNDFCIYIFYSLCFDCRLIILVDIIIIINV